MDGVAGQKVSWLQQQRGGDGYPVSVAAVVTGRSQQSVRIRVARRKADGCHPTETWVEPQSLSERTVEVPAVDRLKLELAESRRRPTTRMRWVDERSVGSAAA